MIDFGYPIRVISCINGTLAPPMKEVAYVYLIPLLAVVGVKDLIREIYHVVKGRKIRGGRKRRGRRGRNSRLGTKRPLDGLRRRESSDRNLSRERRRKCLQSPFVLAPGTGRKRTRINMMRITRTYLKVIL